MAHFGGVRWTRPPPSQMRGRHVGSCDRRASADATAVAATARISATTRRRREIGCTRQFYYRRRESGSRGATAGPCAQIPAALPLPQRSGWPVVSGQAPAARCIERGGDHGSNGFGGGDVRRAAGAPDRAGEEGRTAAGARDQRRRRRANVSGVLRRVSRQGREGRWSGGVSAAEAAGGSDAAREDAS